MILVVTSFHIKSIDQRGNIVFREDKSTSFRIEVRFEVTIAEEDDL